MTTKIQADKQPRKRSHFTTNAHGPGRRCSPKQRAKNQARLSQLEMMVMTGELQPRVIPPGMYTLSRPQRKKKRAS